MSNFDEQSQNLDKEAYEKEKSIDLQISELEKLITKTKEVISEIEKQ
ncbi:hypothetical protein [Mycoplasma capricolum]|nr:hypothetical protein [Mycoplasma capricolum]UVO24802.1 hypothetical protein zly1402F_00235 [Mycoplasma capricolum subsp. capripneumoniae]